MHLNVWELSECSFRRLQRVAQEVFDPCRHAAHGSSSLCLGAGGQLGAWGLAGADEGLGILRTLGSWLLDGHRPSICWVAMALTGGGHFRRGGNNISLPE